MRYPNIPEEELKSRVGKDYFSSYDYQKIIGKIDFCVLPKKIPGQAELFREQSLLWAEAKANSHDIVAMFAQLILTIGKARTFSRHLPPAFLGVFDAAKFAFVAYDRVQHLFYQNDFNWNVAASDHTTKEFSEIKRLIENVIENEKHLYRFEKDDKELRFFIRNNLAKGTESGKIQIDKNNFVPIYLRWLDEIKPMISFDFEHGKKRQILDSDFYLADLFVDDKDTATISDDISIKEDLFVVFQDGGYRVTRENLRSLFDAIVGIKNKTTYENFWKRYKRPPVKAFRDYIIDRRDLLVPQDVRERKGAFFTPKKWVELSQKYIADTLGENWQEEHYVWDCCAGTGNLLAGLTNKRNIFASTLDQGDVQVMRERIKNGANLLENHVFQFDFLNDDFFDVEQNLYDEHGEEVETRKTKSKLPKSLQEIIKDPEERKKLVVYINPPYAEAGNSRTISGTGENKSKTATDKRTYRKYRKEIGRAGNELFAQFLYRIYREMPGCTIANFSKTKNLQGSNFAVFREKFTPKLERLFLMPASTFDNVKGQFPIGFFVWNGAEEEVFHQIAADVYDAERQILESKMVYSYDRAKRINQWLKTFFTSGKNPVGFIGQGRNDFQHVKYVHVCNDPNGLVDKGGVWIGTENLAVVCVYLAVHHSVKATWLNDRDQFLYPRDSWEKDINFHNDCLVFTLFHSQNRITSKDGVNHWIPFTEDEVGAKERFASSFMSDFIKGKIKKTNGNGDLFNPRKVENGTKCEFSTDAQSVLDAGRELWKHYHSQKNIDVNASLYDIREHFQGRNEKGNMNAKSTDEKYTEIMGILRESLGFLADKIAEKVYDHGFLK